MEKRKQEIIAEQKAKIKAAISDSDDSDNDVPCQATSGRQNEAGQAEARSL